MIEVLMPQMGESIVEGTVVRWLKQVGEPVQRDEPLLEISTDKVDAEVPAPAAGVLAEILVPEGETVAVSTVLGHLREPAAAQQATTERPPATAAEGPPSTEATTPPATQPPPPPVAALPPPPPPPPPMPAAPPHEEEPQEPSEAVTQHPKDLAAAIEERRRHRSSPVVRRIAADHEVDIAAVQGTGMGGRVTKRDILSHIDAVVSAPQTQADEMIEFTPLVPDAVDEQTPAPVTPVDPGPEPGQPRVERMSPIRRRTAEHMLASRRTSAHATTLFEIDMTRVEKLKASYKRRYFERGVALTYLPFIVKATVDALKAHPGLNASVDGDSIIYHPTVNVGIAVAVEQGLVVPVIRNAEEKNVLGIATAIGDLAERARTKRLRVDDVQGGTFTVTNPGVFGSQFGTPIIHQPQVAILAVGVVEKRPVVRDDAIAIRTMAYFALTFDHRVIDGADADHFMSQVKRSLQEFDETAL
jgi:pyruvate dehydrogenase E2 component (dihydrolipoamide acetyltransferase)